MKPIAAIVLIAAGHVAFLYAAYGTKFFGLPLPYGVTMALWFGASTIAAGVGYARAAAKLSWFSVQAHSRHFFAIATAPASLFVGVYAAFNTFGT